LNLNQKIAVIITDILLLAEVCISMYFASRSAPEMLTIVFIKTFFMMCIPTLIIAKICIKRLGSITSSVGTEIERG